jgi:hypothetical protein
MKTMRKIRMLAMAMLALSMLQGCYTDDEEKYIDEINQRIGPVSSESIQALVTVKHTPSQSFYLQESEKRRLLPVNMKESPFGMKEVRAIVVYHEVAQSSIASDAVDVYVSWIDSIRTKGTIGSKFLEAIPIGYNGDPTRQVYAPTNIVNDWMNSLSDGYLTLHYYAQEDVLHDIHLITGSNSKDPYEILLWAEPTINGRVMLNQEGLIAFNLDALPSTGGEVKLVTLRWFSPNGWKKAQFYFNKE